MSWGQRDVETVLGEGLAMRCCGTRRNMDMRQMPQVKCHWCGADATHFCRGCGKWICSAPLCVLKSAALAAKLLVLKGE